MAKINLDLIHSHFAYDWESCSQDMETELEYSDETLVKRTLFDNTILFGESGGYIPWPIFGGITEAVER